MRRTGGRVDDEDDDGVICSLRCYSWPLRKALLIVFALQFEEDWTLKQKMLLASISGLMYLSDYRHRL